MQFNELSVNVVSITRFVQCPLEDEFSSKKVSINEKLATVQIRTSSWLKRTFSFHYEA